jgi:hypothetical protein
VTYIPPFSFITFSFILQSDERDSEANVSFSTEAGSAKVYVPKSLKKKNFFKLKKVLTINSFSSFLLLLLSPSSDSIKSYIMVRNHLTLAEKRQQSSVSFYEGCKGSVYGLGLGALTSVLAFRFSPAFRALPKTWQSNMFVTGGVTGYLFASERASFEYKNMALGYVDHKTMDHRAYDSYKALPRGKRESTLRFINDNRWALLGATWATSLAGAYGYSFTKSRLPIKQRLGHARIYAQFITLAAVMLSTGLSLYVNEVDKQILKGIPDGKLRAVLELPFEEQSKIVQQL